MSRLSSPIDQLRNPQPAPAGIEFTEAMKGYFSDQIAADYETAADQGSKANTTFEFTLTIVSDDLERMLSDPAHTARMVGAVIAPSLSPKPLAATDGLLNLLADDPNNVETRQMRYRMRLTSEEGREFTFEGFKSIHPGPITDAWAEASTLYFTLRRGQDLEGDLFGKGILRIRPMDFARQLATLRATHSGSLKERLENTARFGRFFAGALWETYGTVLSRPNFFNPDGAPRQKRPLRAPAPEAYYFSARDGVTLRLLRYRGGPKGPVLLTHGVGVSSLIFRTDMVETNLVEFLVAHGFDAWLLDYRASIELPSVTLQSTADDVASNDYPAAVAKVREVSGAASVQAIVHCFGSASFFMSLLQGLEGVRSVVASQVATHLIAPAPTEIKVGLHVPEFLQALGVKSLTAYVDSHGDWKSRLYEAALRLYPIPLRQQCQSPVCHRITFMYSQVFEHQQLNELLHNNLHELFGIANISAFEHLGVMIRTGHLVSASGANLYMPHLRRLSLPIAFIHGGENQTFLPESTELTYNLLCRKNGASLYSRHVFPQYGHADSVLGKNAARDVFPAIVDHLEAT